MSGRQVRLFLVEGTTGGLVTAEIMNWTGHLISAPRSGLDALLQRTEVRNTGIYLLLGDDPSGRHEARAYIGEGDSVDSRLRAHSRPEDAGGKDFWDRVIVITSKDANITKAHARYLESRLIQIATEARRSSLENGTAPTPQALPEADQADMEYFISQVQIVLPVLGVQVLRSTAQVPRVIGGSPEPPMPHTASVQGEALRRTRESPVFRLRVARNPDRYAHALEIDSEFVVRAGSFGSGIEGVMTPGYRTTRNQLIANGQLAPVEGTEGALLRLDQDVVFRSPSEAASVMNASSDNGRTRWATDGGMTFGAWQAEGSDVR